MSHPPLLAERPEPLQLVVAVAVPAVFGLITGYFLSHSEPVYLVLSLLGILGGLGAGYEHTSFEEGAMRGLAGGSVFGVCILLGHAVAGGEAQAHIPEPHVLLVAVTTAFGVVLGGIGGLLRSRRRNKTAPPDAAA